MKTISTFLLPFFLLSTVSNPVSDYDYRLRQIVYQFKENIMEEENTQRQKNEVSNLVDDIEDELEDDELTPDERNLLKKTKKEAEAVEEFICAVGNNGSCMPRIEDFYLANSRINATITNVATGKYCVDLLSVQIGEFVCYLAVNRDTQATGLGKTFSYRWKAPDGMNTGHGEMGIFNNSVRQIRSNLDNPNLKYIQIYDVKCVATN